MQNIRSFIEKTNVVQNTGKIYGRNYGKWKANAANETQEAKAMHSQNKMQQEKGYLKNKNI